MSHRRTLGGTWSEITKTDVAVNQLWRPAAIMLELSRHSPGAPGARQTTPLQTSASLGPAGLGESRLGTWQHVAHPLLADIGDRRRHRLNGPIGGSCNGLRGTQILAVHAKYFFSKRLIRCVPLCGRRSVSTRRFANRLILR
jgi:hypothetical protein